MLTVNDDSYKYKNVDTIDIEMQMCHCLYWLQAGTWMFCSFI